MLLLLFLGVSVPIPQTAGLGCAGFMDSMILKDFSILTEPCPVDSRLGCPTHGCCCSGEAAERSSRADVIP